MANDMNPGDPRTKPELPEDWQQRALSIARQYGLPVPDSEAIGSPEEVERRLRHAEQEGGE